MINEDRIIIPNTQYLVSFIHKNTKITSKNYLNIGSEFEEINI